METRNLRLEAITRHHASALFRLLWDQGLYQFIPADPPTSEALEERCARWEVQKSPDGSEVWLNWIAYSLDTEEVVGHFQVTLKHDTAVVAYMIAKLHQRKGYATEGLLAVFEFLKSTTKVKTLQSFIDSRNTASIRLIEKLGFLKRQYIENADFFKGETSHEWLFETPLPQP